MRISIKENAYIRQSPERLELEPLGVLFKGTELEVLEEPVLGTSLNGNPFWYVDKKGWYIWSGAVEILDVEVALDYKAIEDFSPLKYMNEKALAWYNKQKGVNWAIVRERIIDKYWYKQNIRGKGVRISILDSGIDVLHPDLENCIQAYGDFSVGPFKTKEDLFGTGTRMASIIAAQGKFRVTGVAPDAQLYVGKIMNYPNLLDPESLIAGLKWSYQLKTDIVLIGPKLIRAAFMDSQWEELKTIIATFSDLNTVFVIPAGDELTENYKESVFASMQNVILVSAHDFGSRIIPTSYSGPEVDVFAPGERLLCARPSSTNGFFSGTQAAASFFTGCLALVIQEYKNRDIKVDARQIKKILTKSLISLKDVSPSKGQKSSSGLFSFESFIKNVQKRLETAHPVKST